MEQLSCAPVKITLSVLPKVEYKAYDVPPVSLRIHINHLVKLLGFSVVVVCKVPPLPPPPIILQKDTASLNFMVSYRSFLALCNLL